MTEVADWHEAAAEVRPIVDALCPGEALSHVQSRLLQVEWGEDTRQELPSDGHKVRVLPIEKFNL